MSEENDVNTEKRLLTLENESRTTILKLADIESSTKVKLSNIENSTKRIEECLMGTLGDESSIGLVNQVRELKKDLAKLQTEASSAKHLAARAMEEQKKQKWMLRGITGTIGFILLYFFKVWEFFRK